MDEKAARKSAMQSALVAATVLPPGDDGAGRAAGGSPGSRSHRSGAGDWLRTRRSARLLAETALRGALLNVRGNAALLKDAVAGPHYREAADRLEAEGRSAAATSVGILHQHGEGVTCFDDRLQRLLRIISGLRRIPVLAA